MPIDRADIERLKNGIDLASYIASRGIALQKYGRNHKGLCPFHAETTPSFTVNPLEGLWHCFGCGAGGDIFNFVERLDKVTFTRAVGIVGKGVGRGSMIVDRKESPSPCPSPLKGEGTLTPSHQKLLNRVVEFYQKELFGDRRGLNYLKERGIHDKQSLMDFGVGFVNGTLKEILPSDGEYEAALKQMGVLNQNGHEMFYGCVVFPLLDFNNNCVGLYGRQTNDESIKHLYLPGPRRGLINRQAFKRSKTVFLTESIIDALSLYANGFKNVIPLYGVNGWTEDHTKVFQQYPPEVVYLCFDSDEAGMKGAYAVKEKLREASFVKREALGESDNASRDTLHASRPKIHIIKLPTKDVNDYFRKYRKEEFEQLLKEANPGSVEESDVHYVKEERFYEPTEYGFRVAYGKREYEIKGIARQGTQLKATIKASLDVKSAHSRFQITTIDLHSFRSKEWFSKVVSQLTGEREELAFEDLNRITEKIEVYETLKKGNKNKTEKVLLTTQEKEEALTFLESTDLFGEILADLEQLGCTGEESNKLVAYLAAVSRKMENPLSVLIRSRSAAGKSTLQDAILALTPEEDVVKYTRLTDQALFYKGEDSLVHKCLAIEEATGMGGAAYSIRAIQSAKELTVATTSKDPATGKMQTAEYKVKGPVAIMMTTTSVELDNEMESRFITMTIDETALMTERIHQKQRKEETLEGFLEKKRGEALRKRHQNAQRLLKPLVVVNPYAPYLKFPSENLRSRRDHKKYLNLMKVIAFLHQYQKEIKEIKEGSETFSYIEVSLEDIGRANYLANEVLGQSLDDLSAPGRTLLKLIHQMVAVKCQELGITVRDFSFNRRMIREYVQWSDWQVKAHIRELEDLGYIYSRVGSKGKEYLYEIQHDISALGLADRPEEPARKVYLGLTEVSQLSQLEKTKVNLEGQKPHLVAL